MAADATESPSTATDGRALNVGDRMKPNWLARLAGYRDRDGGMIEDLRTDEVGAEALISGKWWGEEWLDPWPEPKR